MKLERVDIKNFRSIQDQALGFDRGLQILVGINEAGKSNVIKAISLLDENTEFDKDDIRDPGHEEDAVTSSFVRFVFKVDKDEIRKAHDALGTQVLAKSKGSKIIDIGKKSLTLEEFCNSRDELLYIANLVAETRKLIGWRLSGPKFRIHGHWKKVVEPSPGVLVTSNDEEIDLDEYKIINTKDYSDIPKEYLEDLTVGKLSTLFDNALVEVCEEKIPATIFWKYSEKNLLPGRISYSTFVASPDSCVPLKNMFALAGYPNPTKTLETAEEKTNGVRNILRKVGQNTTDHMQKVWPEWKKQKVSLYQNGDFIEAGIEDEYNVYSLSRRSDGFKRFFTFLLMISAQSKTEDIYHNVILIDEPDIGLHPSGVQYLREELIKISKNNLLLVSTHSIFMIDKTIIDRHLIVEKKAEVTEFKKVESSNIQDEEVILKALGYSLYDLLKPKNIIFEGWRDKHVFSMFTRSAKGKALLDKNKLLGVGLLHAMGVKDVGRIANTCENFMRKYLIITDSDTPAKQRQRQFDGEGVWLCYDEIDGIEAVTTEDFIFTPVINKAIAYVLKLNGVKATIEVPDTMTKDKIAHVKREVSAIFRDKEKTASYMNLIKERITETVKSSDLDDSYSDVCKKLIDSLFEVEAA